MKEEILNVIAKYYPLTKKDAGEFATCKIGPMKFEIEKYEAEGFGVVSVMVAKGLAGLMKMDTIMVGPRTVDAPFLSYDYISAMGKETVMCELYNCVLNDYPMPELDQFNEELKDYESYAPKEEQWYEYLTLPQTCCKIGKKKDRKKFEDVALRYFDTYMSKAKEAPACDPAAKNDKIGEYCEGLIANGGPAVNSWIKAYGREKTGVFLRKVLFGTQD